MRQYTSSDMAKLGCKDCEGCSKCCHSMGDSILLDPYDCFCLEKELNQSFEALMQGKIQLTVSDGLILPALSMQESTGACGFLNGEGRCSIHGFRPGLCRLFPLGRNYEEGRMKYFLLEHACEKENRTKIKIDKWLGIESLSENERFVTDWHYYLKSVSQKVAALPEDEKEAARKTASMNILQNFYLTPFQFNQSFYPQYQSRRGL